VAYFKVHPRHLSEETKENLSHDTGPLSRGLNPGSAKQEAGVFTTLRSVGWLSSPLYTEVSVLPVLPIIALLLFSHRSKLRISVLPRVCSSVSGSEATYGSPKL